MSTWFRALFALSLLSILFLAFLASFATAVFFFQTAAHAQAGAKERSAFEQALEHNMNFETKERWVQYGGTRYREVEYQGKTYYVKFTGRTEEFAKLDCDVPSGVLNPSLLEGGIKVFRRSKVFVSFLKETCETKHGQRRQDVNFNAIAVEFTIPEGKNDLIKNKKVLLSPATGLGFYGEW